MLYLRVLGAGDVADIVLPYYRCRYCNQRKQTGESITRIVCGTQSSLQYDFYITVVVTGHGNACEIVVWCDRAYL